MTLIKEINSYQGRQSDFLDIAYKKANRFSDFHINAH